MRPNTATSDRRHHHRRHALWLMHLSMAIILCGGIITHFLEQQGDIRLRTGETTHEFMAHDKENGTTVPVMLPFRLTLTNFRIEQDSTGHTDYASTVIVRRHSDADTTDIAMNRPLIACGYRILQTSYDDDMRGTRLSVIYDPIGTTTTLFGYAMFLLAALYLLLGKAVRTLRQHSRHHINAKEKATAMAVTLLSLLPLLPLFTEPLRPILRTPLLYVHVSTVMAAYILLTLSMLRRAILEAAILLLAIGIVLGSVWGCISWGSYWSWDPKETWALITLLLYSLPLHARRLPLLQRPRVYSIYSLICLLALLVTYLGVNFFMHSMHSYLG